MIVRIVELQLDPPQISLAEKLLEEVAPKVRAMQGCSRLEILSDIHKPGHITTYSYWSDEAALNQYRSSQTFTEFWRKIKPMFMAPARAWSSLQTHFLP